LHDSQPITSATTTRRRRKRRGVSHYGLAIYIKKYLNAKEEL
jgi:hypothetical protein